VCDALYRAEEEMKELWGFISSGDEGLQLFGDSLWGSRERLTTLPRIFTLVDSLSSDS
jgi:hypothetical protein